ncbi:50S ribosomal protein L32e [Acidianus sulfidivorans JP7]|uniref:Large ribosomal subunit protein eL32 n=1 Tax=Acidianus sulfidivorans JP7 TaxID=619593 RepID=A0A2U9IML1_9CREN|nr:50S ribosomal protein L32e [Acidianus sulfidivorans]AWR97299.1 50S ribosomal protein L32e [Acidianus sulfidivorans JP7]
MTENSLSKEKIYKLKLEYKSRLPKFLRYDWDKYFKLERQEKWRRPRGIDNKTRLGYRGFIPLVDPGYRTPKSIRYLHPSGLKQVVVHNVSDLDKIKDKKNEIIVTISSNVGLRKRLDIIRKAKELGLKLTNGE